MEIAHSQTKVLRVIGKLILLGLLVVLLAKVFVALLVLAVIGLVTWAVVRALYNRRSAIQRIVFRTKERLVRLAEILMILTALVGSLVYCLAKISCGTAWKFVRQIVVVTISALFGLLCGVKIVVATLGHGAGNAVAKIGNQSSVIFGTFVEGSSGALVGAMLGFVPTFLPHGHPTEARVGGAALFGAFLGIVVALSRTTWSRQEEQGNFQQN